MESGNESGVPHVAVNCTFPVLLICRNLVLRQMFRIRPVRVQNLGNFLNGMYQCPVRLVRLAVGWSVFLTCTTPRVMTHAAVGQGTDTEGYAVCMYRLCLSANRTQFTACLTRSHSDGPWIAFHELRDVL
jgi:hypothetical protein